MSSFRSPWPELDHTGAMHTREWHTEGPRPLRSAGMGCPRGDGIQPPPCPAGRGGPRGDGIRGTVKGSDQGDPKLLNEHDM